MLNIRKFSATVALLSVFCSEAIAGSYEFDNFTVEWDSVFTAGMQWRIQDRKRHISRGSDGTSGALDDLPGLIDNAFIINSNDGNNAFDKGITSQRLSLLTEADFNFGDWGIFIRAKYWHDFVYSGDADTSEEAWLSHNANPIFGDNGGHNTSFGRFNPGAKDYAESGSSLLDFFWYGIIPLPDDQELSIRIGRQVISWGEAMLSGGGLATAINHVDAHIRNQPGLEIKELFLPTGAVFVQTALNDYVNLEAYVQYEWNPALIDPSGTYFSEFDSIGLGGNTFMFVTGHEDRILGKDLTILDDCTPVDPCWTVTHENMEKLLKFLPTSCPSATNDVERSRCKGLISKKVLEDKPGDHGQFGIALNFFLDSGDEIGLYYVNYHEKIPNFILPIDAIETMAPVIDLLVRVADPTHYANVTAPNGGFKGINDLSGDLSLPQINGLLLFLSALPEVEGTIGTITYDLVRDPEKIFGEGCGDGLFQMSCTLKDDPLASALLTAVSTSAVDWILPQFGFDSNTPVRSINNRLHYQPNVKMLGFTYSTVIGDANVATELTYRDNTPLMRGDVPRTPDRDSLFNWHVNSLMVFEPQELWGMQLWDFASLVVEGLVWYVPNRLDFDPDDTTNPERLAVQNTSNGVGASFFLGLEYHNIAPGWDIFVPIYMNWGIDGSMFNSGYRDGQVTAATGVTFRHLSGMEMGMGITKFFGDSDDIFQMLTQDRDNMTVHFKYGF